MERNLRKERIGVVVSSKMEKSITVAVHTKEKHPIYGKFVNKTKKFTAHDEENTCNEGDTVKIMETRRNIARLVTELRHRQLTEK
jgi:small subunit ribosomal protein S17